MSHIPLYCLAHEYSLLFHQAFYQVAETTMSFQEDLKMSHLTKRNLILLSLIPFLTLFMIWTNNFHHLFGMDDYISKPIKSEKLYTCLKKYAFY